MIRILAHDARLKSIADIQRRFVDSPWTFVLKHGHDVLRVLERSDHEHRQDRQACRPGRSVVNVDIENVLVCLTRIPARGESLAEDRRDTEYIASAYPAHYILAPPFAPAQYNPRPSNPQPSSSHLTLRLPSAATPSLDASTTLAAGLSTRYCQLSGAFASTPSWTTQRDLHGTYSITTWPYSR